MVSKLDKFRVCAADVAKLCGSKSGQIGLQNILTFAWSSLSQAILHEHQIEEWDLSGPFVQDQLSWPVVCIVDLAHDEWRRHVLVEASAAKTELADSVVVVPVQNFVAHAQFELDQLRKVSERLRYYLALRSSPSPHVS